MTGKLYGVGLGPGDPELVTVKAARLIAAAEVVAFHSARHGNSVARGIAAQYLSGSQIEEPLLYPVTVETTDHPGGYRGALEEFYDEAAARLAAHLDAGRDVVVLCEGDPFFYGSYMHLHKRLADRYDAEVVPGVTSVAGAAAELGRPLVEAEETLTVLPGTLPPTELAARLAAADSAVVMKLGRTFSGVRDALAASGRLEEAWYVERATTDRQRIAPLRDVDPVTVPYFSLALLPSKLSPQVSGAQAIEARGAGEPVCEPASGSHASEPIEPVERRRSEHTTAERVAAAPGLSGFVEPSGLTGAPSRPGEVVVVGLGPAGRDWLTPQAQAALAAAEDLVGYGPYLDRVPLNPRQRRHASDNQVEDVRAEFALDLARRGHRVAVVSSGDPGIFAMAAAVLEAAEAQEYKDVRVRVLPGLTAAAAVASRVGAPLGGDFAVVSLSDRLKPWEVIETRLAGIGAADLVLAVYNPASKTRTWQLARARELLLEHRAPQTPVIVGRDVGGPAERVVVTTLGDLDPAQVDMRCLLIVGSSATRVIERGDGSRVVLTPRRFVDEDQKVRMGY
ncbi:MAG: precorrin-2 C(20)-methyltransferase [Sporichthyaceae bacterium]